MCNSVKILELWNVKVFSVICRHFGTGWKTILMSSQSCTKPPRLTWLVRHNTWQCSRLVPHTSPMHSLAFCVLFAPRAACKYTIISVSLCQGRQGYVPVSSFLTPLLRDSFCASQHKEINPKRWRLFKCIFFILIQGKNLENITFTCL